MSEQVLAPVAEPAPEPGTGPAPVATLEATQPTSQPEKSVNPTINESYRKAKSHRPWVRRFEREGREVYDNQAQILAAMALEPGMRVADVGAGTGLFSVPFARQVGSTGKVYAVDVMPYFLDHLRKKAKKKQLSQLEVVEAKERAVGLAPGSVDLVFFSDSYHHIEYPRTYLETVFAALKPGGSVVLIDYRRDAELNGDWILKHVRADQATVVAEFEAAGFELVETRDKLLKENYYVRFRRPG
ncbi:MAG: class I SAM-dependent methyltransferase [Nannocystaceae bacterium]